ncbi:MAG: cytochrome c3 family protein, partial [Planctomycetes bacterium]|nr:cytochrome c3 family protein [Planctomycetota bacterium]
SDGGVIGEAEGWYRFLGDHQNGTYGVQGIEDSDWEQNISASDHNEYKGSATSPYNHSLSRWCSGCHYNFHEVNGTNYQSNEWYRHPVNTALPGGGEYADYTAYPLTGPVAPVARPDLGTFTGSSAVVRPGADQVFCLSCHRAHGSPYPDMLRWNYDAIISGSGASTDGCFACHTGKDTL